MLFANDVFTLIVAPPAWGKTHLIHQWLEQEIQILYISPLRALAIEVSKKFQSPQIQVVTPEEIMSLDWEWWAKENPTTVVVWDEVHLVQEWGETFRHPLLEAWYGFNLTKLCGVGLTATAGEGFYQFLRSTCEHECLIEADAGNFAFRYEEPKFLVGPAVWIEDLTLLGSQGRSLIFCHHRHEVDGWIEKLTAEGFTAWGCKGGETRAFQERMQNYAHPEFIVATSCLSHGVNLGSLRRVIIFDTSIPPWLFHQMVTRGGRRGERYEVWVNWKVAPWRLRIRGLLRLCGRVMIRTLSSKWQVFWHGP